LSLKGHNSRRALVRNTACSTVSRNIPDASRDASSIDGSSNNPTKTAKRSARWLQQDGASA
jgi:hypothetical protein